MDLSILGPTVNWSFRMERPCASGGRPRSLACRYPTRRRISGACRLHRLRRVQHVRFHHNDIPRRGLGYLQENPKSNSLVEPGEMDKLDRFAAELYKRGVYVYLDFADFRPFLPEDGLEDGEAMNQLENKGWKGVFPHPKIVEAWQRAVTQFLSHVNPYTGRKWGEEPGVGTVEIINENGLFWTGTSR